MFYGTGRVWAVLEKPPQKWAAIQSQIANNPVYKDWIQSRRFYRVDLKKPSNRTYRSRQKPKKKANPIVRSQRKSKSRKRADLQSLPLDYDEDIQVFI